MKLFFAYLRQRWKVLLGAVLFYALFTVSFALYGLPLEAVWYPAALAAVLGLIFFLWDFGRIRRTHAELSALSNVSAEQIGPLPETSRILDGDYQIADGSYEVKLDLQSNGASQASITANGAVSELSKGESVHIDMDSLRLETTLLNGSSSYVEFAGSYYVNPLEDEIMQPDGGWHYARVCKDGPVFDAKEVCLRG